LFNEPHIFIIAQTARKNKGGLAALKKDNIRDYATDAFRYYAEQGKPSYEKLKQAIYNEALKKSKRELSGLKRSGISDPTAQAVISAERAVDERAGELRDILAVENTLKIIAFLPMGAGILRSIEYVYFEEPDKELEWGDISRRVTVASLNIPAGEDSIYRWLRKAREVFAVERGLRIKK
jgi:hypothetical protein